MVKRKIAEALVRLERLAYLELEEHFIAVANVDDLRVHDRIAFEACSGLGVCSRCRWMSGCDSSDKVKSWGVACRMTLWHTASEQLRPKAKPRGRPKKAA